MKDEIRTRVLSQRAELCADEIQRLSDKICTKVFNLPEYKNAKKIMVYMSCRGEVMTDKIIADALSSGKRIYAPVTISAADMVVAEYTGSLKKGRFGIKEPLGEEISPEELDLVIVPGVAFDRRGNRIGYGAGYYDRFLLKTKAYTVGLAYGFQIVEDTFPQETDVKLQAIISE